MKKSTMLSRRRFLARTAGTTAFLAAAPLFVPSRVFGANDRITTGHIGLGGQGRGNLRAFSNNAVALCDVDSRHLQAAAKEAMDRGANCQLFGDYRELLDQDGIDAVVISTPDHWHSLCVIHACQAGKDVYCEKPLSLTIAEGRAMVKAARDNNRIVQTGSQQRSADNFRKACELVRNGYLGKIREVHVGIAESNHPFRNREPIADSDPPAELNYDLWLGQAPLRPYNELRVHYNFRFFWDYSGGQMTNWGAHHIDIAHWGLGMDDSGPLEVSGEAEFNSNGWHDVSEACRITYRYPNDVTMIVGQRQPDIIMGTKFIGELGTLHVDRGKLSADPAEILDVQFKSDDVRLISSNNHHQNFLESMQSRELPICDVEIGHRTATACHLGNIAIRLGRSIRWNSVQEQIEGDDEAAAMVARPQRAPWTING